MCTDFNIQPPIPLRSIGDESIYDAKKFKRECPQLITEEDIKYLKENSAVAEDCLYLNVFTISVSTYIGGSSLLFNILTCRNLLPALYYMFGYFCILKSNFLCSVAG